MNALVNRTMTLHSVYISEAESKPALLPTLPDGTLSGAALPPRRLLWAAALTALRPWL